MTPAVMGIINTTPDSFFPDSRASTTHVAVTRGRRFFDLGAAVVDVGGESTRPGAREVTVDDEMARVIDVVAALAPHGQVSIDTQKPEVARAAIAAGAVIINDVSGSLVDLAGELGVGYVAMHRLGPSSTMQRDPRYDDVVAEVAEYLATLAARARRGGVGRLWLDPGIGFGKTVEHNLQLLAHLDDFIDVARRFDAEVLVGTSRKRFLEHLGAKPVAVHDRLEGSLASAAWSMLSGVAMVRVHDVAETLLVRDLMARSFDEVLA